MALEKLYSFNSIDTFISDVVNGSIVFNNSATPDFHGFVREGRLGEQCLKIVDKGTNSFSDNQIRIAIPDNCRTSMIFGFAFKMTTDFVGYENGMIELRAWEPGDYESFRMFFYTGGLIRFVDDNDNILGYSSKQLQDQVWYYIEISIQFLNSTTRQTEIRIDGETVLNLDSGLDFCEFNCPPIFIDIFQNNVPNNTFWLNDIYFVSPDVSPGPTGFLGDIFVEDLFPTGNGITNNFIGSDSSQTGNWQWVRETGLAVTGDYVEGSGVNSIELYNIQNLPNYVDVVHAIQSNSYIEKSNAGNLFYNSVVRVSGSNYFSSNYGISTDPFSHAALMVNNPANTGSWTRQEINDLQIGIRLTS